jgi:hypothetical protein
VWDPTGDLITVALETLDTTECCIPNGGKPFYQMQMGFSHMTEAHLAGAGLLFVKRSAWCTETVGYWHLRARSPYPNGYSTWWHPSWQLRNTTQIRQWYQTEEAIHGHGRWIDAESLDLNDFRPGYNAPCPGAYQQIMGYAPEADWWFGSGDAHSQIISTMTVYVLGDGTVVDFDLNMLEGNSGNRVNNENVYESAPRYTPQGGNTSDDFIGWPEKRRKIRGWGIDLDADGNPICYEDRIFYRPWSPDLPPPHPEFVPRPVEIDQVDRAAVKKNMDFARAVAEDGGPTISFGDGQEMVAELPSPTSPWVVEDDVFEVDRASVYIKYPKPLPDPVEMVEIRFAGTNIPEEVTVVAKEYGRKTLLGHPRGKIRNREVSLELAADMPTAILIFDKAITAKKFRIGLKRRPTESGGSVKITNLSFHAYLDPAHEDSDINE